MRSIADPICLSLGLVLAASAAQAAGTVQISYVQPDQFADAGDARRDVEGNLKQLTQHFEGLAVRHLADGQKLRIEVLDVDLAGDVRPWRSAAGQDLRILRGRADWPRIKLRYTLEAPGQAAPRSGEQTVADMAYLQRIGGGYANEPLRHEKRMLDEWFAAQFGAAGTK